MLIMTMNEMYVRRMYSDLMNFNQVDMIKATSDFANYLEATFKAEMSYKNTGDAYEIVAEFKGIPVFVDDTIDGCYEIIH